MLIAEYDYEMDISVQREEAEAKGRQKGWEEGLKEGRLDMTISLLKDGYLTLHDAAVVSGISEENLQKLLANHLDKS